MDRCDYCIKRFSWDCDEAVGHRCDPDVVCKSFQLDFATLGNKKQLKIQKLLMKMEEK